MKRILVLLTVAVMTALIMAFSGVAAAQGGDVCVSNKGETKVQKGASTCSSSPTSHAVATNGSDATANGSDSKANAHNDSSATTVGSDNKASATNGSSATCVGSDCTAKAHNG
jgi:hypothetical protein